MVSPPKVFIIKCGVIFHFWAKGYTIWSVLEKNDKGDKFEKPPTTFLTPLSVDAKQNKDPAKHHGWWAMSHLTSQAISVVQQVVPGSWI